MVHWTKYLGFISIYFILRKGVAMDSSDSEKVILAHTGQQVVLKCPTISTATWIVNGQKLQYPGPTFIILSVKETDGGEYVCLGWDRHQERRYTARVVVGGEFDPSRAIPKVRRAEVGDDVQLLCHSNGHADWYFKTDKLAPADVIHNEGKKVLKISQVSLDGSGYYFCSGYKENHTKFLTAFQVMVNSWEYIDPSTQVVPVNSSTYIKCLSSSPVEWNKRDQPMPYNVRTAPDNKLMIVNASLENRGYYECKGQDMSGDDFYSFSLLKIRIQDDSRIVPGNRSVNTGDFTYFICLSNRNVTWTLNGKTIPHELVRVFSEKHWPMMKHYIAINEADEMHQGTYECQGEEDDFLLFTAKAVLYLDYEDGFRGAFMAQDGQSNGQFLLGQIWSIFSAILFVFILSS